MTLPGSSSSRRLTLLIAVQACFLVLVLASSATRAQNLQTITCPAGPGPIYSPFGISAFDPVMVGTPMLRHTLTGPDSVCNDGTPAIMYVRPATATFNGYWDRQLGVQPIEFPERWVIMLHGGGGCRDEDHCLDRWCSATGKSLDRAGKMSTLDAHDAIVGTGIMRRRPDNRFAGYNQVLVNYCSSDNWVGSDSKAGVVTSSGTAYDIEFQGEAIVRDVMDTLIAGGVMPDPGLGFWQDSLPSILTAEEIIFAGDSAGGGGLRHHLDRLRDQLRALLPPETDIAGVIDAGVGPAMWDPGINWASAPVVDYTDYLLTSVLDGMTFWGTDDTAIDDSCLDPAWAGAHAAIGSHPEICYDTTYTLFHHIDTPLFVGMDINDTLGRQIYQDWGLFGNLPDYWDAQFNLLRDLGTWGGGLEPTPPHGVFGPKCDEHVRIVGSKFFSQGVRQPGAGVGPSFHGLLVNWLDGVAPSTQVQQDFNAGLPYTASDCP